MGGVKTVEGRVENGRIRVLSNIRLPEDTRVLVVIPSDVPPARIASPRLADPRQAADFMMNVSEESPDTGVRPGTV